MRIESTFVTDHCREVPLFLLDENGNVTDVLETAAECFDYTESINITFSDIQDNQTFSDVIAYANGTVLFLNGTFILQHDLAASNFTVIDLYLNTTCCYNATNTTAHDNFPTINAAVHISHSFVFIIYSNLITRMLVTKRQYSSV